MRSRRHLKPSSVKTHFLTVASRARDHATYPQSFVFHLYRYVLQQNDSHHLYYSCYYVGPSFLVVETPLINVVLDHYFPLVSVMLFSICDSCEKSFPLQSSLSLFLLPEFHESEGLQQIHYDAPNPKKWYLLTKLWNSKWNGLIYLAHLEYNDSPHSMIKTIP